MLDYGDPLMLLQEGHQLPGPWLTVESKTEHKRELLDIFLVDSLMWFYKTKALNKWL